MQRQHRSVVDRPIEGAVPTIPADAVVDERPHETAPAVVVRADQVQTGRSTRRSEGDPDTFIWEVDG